MTVRLQVDNEIEALLARFDWWRLPPRMYAKMEEILKRLYLLGLNREAGRIDALRFGMDEPAYMAIAWNIDDPRITELLRAHAAEMVVKVDEGTKFFLRRIIKKNYTKGTTEVVKAIQSELFGLPPKEAAKLPRDRLKSIVNYETNRAMSGAAQLLRDQLGLKFKQWFYNSINPCEICIGNSDQAVVQRDFLYEGVFGQILHPPAHPRTCRCVVMAVESEVRSVLGTQPIDWPMAQNVGELVRYPP